jgi:hypothetical protein
VTKTNKSTNPIAVNATGPRMKFALSKEKHATNKNKLLQKNVCFLYINL